MEDKCPFCGSKHIRVVSSEQVNIAIIYDEQGNNISEKIIPVDFFGWWGNCLDCGKQFDGRDFEDD